jgi:ABC-2 type transport system permease protein
MTPRIVGATARRVLLQLRSDRRTVALLVVVPSLLLVLTHEMIDSRPTFNRLALSLLGVFPFTTMFLVTSVAMLRERTSGTLERLLTMPMAKLDLLLGYGVAFALAAAVQAGATCGVAYGLLGLHTPGAPAVVVGVAVLDAVMGMAIGLLASAFATSEFQAVQFMPAIVLPQVLLGGLFVPRSQMADWLDHLSDALPLTYAMDALSEVGSTSIVTDVLLRDVAIVAATAFVALALAAATLRRQAGRLPRGARRALVTIPIAVTAASAVVAAVVVGDARDHVATDDARIDGDALPIRAPATGTLVGWTVTSGAAVRAGEPLGYIELAGAFARPRMVVRAPADGTVVVDGALAGDYVATGTALAVATDLTRVRVTALVDETLVDQVQVGQRVDIAVDAFPAEPLAGVVVDVRRSTADATGPLPASSATGEFQKIAQVVPVRIAIADPHGLALVPGMSATVRILRG